MRILLVGSGGREHALAWKISQSRRTEQLFIAPGNAGTRLHGENLPIPADDISQLLQFAKSQQIDLAVIGPEAPLAAGLADVLRSEGVSVFGPSRKAAELEASKAFCKDMLRQADIPTAEFRAFDAATTASEFLNAREDQPWVVKADGLAAGKGVFVCQSREEALEAIEEVATARKFGAAGDRFIIEEKLRGREASVLAITDGKTLMTLPPAQDHKPAFDGDRGPNTGGMGAFCPTPRVDDALLAKVESDILVRMIHQMNRLERPFVGVLYAGLMLTSQGPKVLEFNVRFGDPECQPLMMRMQSDLVPILRAAADGRLREVEPPRWDPRPAVSVVMASEGYPGDYAKGHVIRGLDAAAELPNVAVFHAGTRQEGEQIVTSGGRVLAVTALGETMAKAKLSAYQAVKCIRWEGAWCRKDIGDQLD